MAANKKFTPRASSNLIEGEVVENKKAPIVEEEEIPAEPETEIPADVEEEVEEEAPVVEAPIEEKSDKDSDKKDKTEKVIEKKNDEQTEKAEEKSITFTADTESKPIERMVKIKLARKYDGCIGGVWYHFAKDETVIVPENLKRILSNVEGMLKPL